MPSIARETADPELTVTRIVPLPSPSVPVSCGIDMIVSELRTYDVNTAHLHEAAQQLDAITTRASKALYDKDITGVHHFLEEAINTMREAILILKLLCIIERDHLPGDVFEHLVATRELIQRVMNEAYATLKKPVPG
jgi:hypothetical protein